MPDQMVTAAVAAPGAQRQGPAQASPQGWAVLDPTNSPLEEGRPSWSLLTEGDLGVDRVIRAREECPKGYPFRLERHRKHF